MIHLMPCGCTIKEEEGDISIRFKQCTLHRAAPNLLKELEFWVQYLEQSPNFTNTLAPLRYAIAQAKDI